MLENLSSTLEQEHPELLSTIRRHLNSLKENQIGTRKKAISQLLSIVKTQQLIAYQFEELTQLCLKDCLKCFSDNAEHCRQTSVDIIIQLLPRCKNITVFLPYIFSILIDRSNCYDLQGIANLPQKMKPAPGQKPKVMVKLVQSCEQIRLKFCHLLRKIIGLAQQSDIRKHLDDMVNIMRALAMDPAGQIQKYSCQTIQIFCKQYKLLLLHYTQILGRAVLLPLISKKSKIRIAALNALTAIFWCGLWKYNAFVFENLIGFRDPNSVPIKDFYQPSHNINYLATFIIDQNPKVRLQFLKHLDIWVCKLDDKYDHHGKLVPYVLSGLFDSDDEIRKIALQTIVDIGQQIQVERQKDFRENKQFAIDAAWTWDGKMIDLPIIEPLTKRPSIGSRFFIRGHVRKMWGALYHEINDINYQNRKRAANLMVYGVIFTENYLTQFLDVFIPKTISCIITSPNQDQYVSNKISLIYHYIGRYCEQSSYLHIIKSILAAQLVQNEHFIRCGLKGLAYLIKGNFEDIPDSEEGLCRKKKDIDQLLTMIGNIGLANQVFHGNCPQAKQLCKNLVAGLRLKANREDISDIFCVHFSTITKLIAVSYYQENFYSFSTIKSQKKQIKNNSILQFLIPMIQTCNNLWPSYCEELKDFIGEIFFSISSATQCLGLEDSNWKFILVLHNYLVFSSFNKQDSTQQQVLFALIQDVIKENLKYNFSLQMMHFLVKYLSHIIHNSSSSKFKDRILSSSQILAIILEKLEKFELIKKVPLYDQHLVNAQKDNNLPSLQQDTFYLTYINCSHAIQSYYLEKLQITPHILAHILYYFTKTHVKVRRSQQCTMQSIKTMWVAFQRNELLNLQFPNLFTIGQQKQPAFPKMIDFMIQRFETLGEVPDPKKVNMIFAVLTNMLKCWPLMPLATDKIPFIYPQYPELLDTFFKYALNEKDIQTKSKFCNFLQKLCKKMVGWFKHEAKISNESKRFEKARFLEQIIKNAGV